MRPLCLLSALGLSCALLAPDSAFAQIYSIHDLGIPPNFAFSQANGINQAGQIVGSAGFYDGGLPIELSTYSFLYSEGKFIPLDFSGLAIAGGKGTDRWQDQEKRKLRIAGNNRTSAVLYEDQFARELGALPGDTSSAGLGVNSSGEVVGVSYPPGGAEHAFLYKDGNLFNLGNFPGGSGAQAFGINDEGDVTGEAFLANGRGHAFLYHKEKMIDLGTLKGAVYSVGQAINNDVQITGYSYSNDFSFAHAFLWSKGKMIDLGVLPNGTLSEGRGINSWGQVVGFSDTLLPSFPGVYVNHAFLYSNGKMHDLDTMIPPNSGWLIGEAVGINDRGEIAATGEINGQTHAVLLTLDCKDRRNRECEPCRNGR
jgi:probable HAF family extracellular repeat protein